MQTGYRAAPGGRSRIGPMRMQVIGALVVVAVLLALRVVPLEPPLRALTAALVITIGGGIMAFLRSRKTTS